MSFFSCLALGKIESLILRKAWSTAMGIYIGFYFYGLLYFWNIAYVLVAYMLIACCSRTVGANLMTWWGAICLMSVSYYHYHVKGADDGSFDIDLIFMMNFVKLHMFAVNYDNAGKLDT